MVKLLRMRHLLTTVTSVVVYVKEVVIEFYCNMLKSIRDVNSAKYEKFFLRNRIYHFTLEFVNEFYETENIDDDKEVDNLHEIIVTFSGGMMHQWTQATEKTCVH